jgi:hypothetical protein
MPLEMKMAAARYREKEKEALSGYQRDTFSVKYDRLVREGMRENPAAEKEAGKRGEGETGQGPAAVKTA